MTVIKVGQIFKHKQIPNSFYKIKRVYDVNKFEGEFLSACGIHEDVITYFDLITYELEEFNRNYEPSKLSETRYNFLKLLAK